MRRPILRTELRHQRRGRIIEPIHNTDHQTLIPLAGVMGIRQTIGEPAVMNLHTETVEYQHEGTVLEGYIAWDDSTSEPRPGVLVSHAWAGRSAFEQQ